MHDPRFLVQRGLTDRYPDSIEHAFETLDEAKEDFEKCYSRQRYSEWRIAKWDDEKKDFIVYYTYDPGTGEVTSRS